VYLLSKWPSQRHKQMTSLTLTSEDLLMLSLSLAKIESEDESVVEAELDKYRREVLNGRSKPKKTKGP